MEAFVTFYSSNDWTAIGPEIALALAAMTILVMDLFGKDKFSGRPGLFAIAFQAVLLVAHLISYASENSSNSYFSGMIEQSLQSDLMRSFFLLSSLLVSILAHRYLCKNRLASGEFHHLTMLATAGLMLLCQSSHFHVVRGLGNGRHLLLRPCRLQPQCIQVLEAGIKYLVFGALSSSLLLLGIVLLYGVGANPEAWGASYPGYESMDPLSFQYLGNLMDENPDNLLLRAGVVLIIAGIAFKVGRPFSIWVPDAYHGSPMAITAFGRFLEGGRLFRLVELGERPIRRGWRSFSFRYLVSWPPSPSFSATLRLAPSVTSSECLGLRRRPRRLPCLLPSWLP